jgi:hypothetical protein
MGVEEGHIHRGMLRYKCRSLYEKTMENVTGYPVACYSYYILMCYKN